MRFRRPRDRASSAAELAEVRSRLEHVEQRLAEHDFAHAHQEDRLADGERAIDALAVVATMVDRIVATTALIAGLPPASEVVSVVMPTRDRAHILPAALASVRAQSHAAWELIVVDDGSTDATPGLLAQAACDDPRIRVLRTDGSGPSAARNLALDHVTGRYVTYLDDDNAMGPHWLRSIVWAFDRDRDARVGYGARVMDHPSAGTPWIELRPWDRPAASPPWIDLQPWDRQLMQVRCLIDQNTLTHHAGLPEVRYDVGIDAGSDWDVAIRATAERDPVMIPVIATIYGTEMDDRMSTAPGAIVEWVQVQRRALRRSPLKILGVDLASPPLSDDEAEQSVQDWRRLGADVAWCVEGRPAPELDVPCWQNLGQAIAEFSPTMVALQAGRVARSQLARLERTGRAFAVVTPPGADAAELAATQHHLLCIGVWSRPGPSLEELLAALDLVRARQFGLPDSAALLALAVAREGSAPDGAVHLA